MSERTPAGVEEERVERAILGEPRPPGDRRRLHDVAHVRECHGAAPVEPRRPEPEAGPGDRALSARRRRERCLHARRTRAGAKRAPPAPEESWRDRRGPPERPRRPRAATKRRRSPPPGSPPSVEAA